MVNYEHMGGMREADPAAVAKLRNKLVDSSTTLSQKYRILFSLRNLAGSNAHEAMLLGNPRHLHIMHCKMKLNLCHTRASLILSADGPSHIDTILHPHPSILY